MAMGAGWPLVILGLVLLAGYLAHVMGARVHVPRVTLLLLLGLLVGPPVLDIVPHQVSQWFPLVTHMALAIVGFLLGERLIGRDLRRSGAAVLWVSIGETLLSATTVFVGVMLVGAPLPLALLLAGIAPASAPAATLDIVREGHAKGPLTQTVLGVVAIDDAWGVILFSVLMMATEAVLRISVSATALLSGLWDVGGALGLGLLLGLPMAWLTGRLKPGEPALIEAAGFVFLCGGLATVLHVSYLVACMVMGAVVANRARHHSRPFHAIEGISEPFLSLFFVLAGFKLELSTLAHLGWLGTIYVVARSAGLIVGGRIGAMLGKASPVVRSRVGWCLLPQAGVALGLALLASDRFPELGAKVLPLIIGTTVLFELIGPLVTRWELHQAGEL